MNNKGSVLLYILVFVIGAFLLVLVAVIAPLGVKLNSELYLASENIKDDLAPSFSSSPELESQINNFTSATLEAQSFNIEAQTDIFQYGWIIVLVLTGFIVFLLTRTMVERQVGGGMT